MSMKDFINRHLTVINWSIRILVAIMFIYGAFTKMFPINAFEKQLVDLGICDWCVVPYFSRSIIAFELFLGIALLQPYFLKKYIIPLTILLLLAFCIHLSIVLYMYGNSGNCGCFGQALPMTPLAALIKNVISIFLLGFLYVRTKESKDYYVIVPVLLLLVSFAYVYLKIPVINYCCLCGQSSTSVISPIVTTPGDTSETIITPENNSGQITEKNKENNSTSTPEKNNNNSVASKDSVVKTAPVQTGPPRVTSAFANFRKFSGGVTTDLDDGIKVVCLFNLDCDHCMETCRQMCELSKKINVPAYLICWGEESQTDNFFKTSGCRYPYTIVGPEIFFPLLGKAPSPPRVVVLHNGNIIADWDSETFSATKLEGLLKK